MANDYYAQGDSAKASEYYERALAIFEKVLGQAHLDTAKSYNNIANAYNAHGETAKALEYYERALAIFEKVLGKEHPDTLVCMYNRGRLLLAKGDPQSLRVAEELRRKIQDIESKTE